MPVGMPGLGWPHISRPVCVISSQMRFDVPAAGGLIPCSGPARTANIRQPQLNLTVPCIGYFSCCSRAGITGICIAVGIVASRPRAGGSINHVLLRQNDAAQQKKDRDRPDAAPYQMVLHINPLRIKLAAMKSELRMVRIIFLTKYNKIMTKSTARIF